MQGLNSLLLPPFAAGYLHVRKIFFAQSFFAASCVNYIIHLQYVDAKCITHA